MRVRSMDPFIYKENAKESERLPLVLQPEKKETQGASPDIVSGIRKYISRMKKDDFILIGIIAVLFFEGSDDYVLMAVLGYLFMMGVL